MHSWECTGLVVRASDSGSGDPRSILGRVGVLFPLARDIYSPKVLVIPRNRWLRLNMTEKMFTGTLNKNKNKSILGHNRPLYTRLEMNSVMLACSRFKGKHTAEKIQQEYEETVSSFEIGHKVSNIVTDNAANMVKAFNFSLLRFESEVKLMKMRHM